VLVVIAVVAVTLGVVLSQQKNSEEDPVVQPTSARILPTIPSTNIPTLMSSSKPTQQQSTPSPTTSNSLQPTRPRFESLRDVFSDPNDLQLQVLYVMANDESTSMEDSSFQLFDRYIILYLYFHSHGWDGQFALLSPSSICD
jgi:hypothetical protein